MPCNVPVGTNTWDMIGTRPEISVVDDSALLMSTAVFSALTNASFSRDSVNWARVTE